jgi:hypothetical protein
MIPFRFLLIFLWTTFFVNATMHEDAEDRKTSRWRVINSNFSNNINNINDLNKKSRVIEFLGEGTKQAYEFRTKKIKKNEYWLSWQMKFSEDFVIIIVLNTNLGEHYLIYTPGTLNSYMQYGLGYGVSIGEWQTLRRNLQEDISYFDNRVKVISLKSFVLKGNGKIDNIMMQRVDLVKEKISQKREAKKNF